MKTRHAPSRSGLAMVAVLLTLLALLVLCTPFLMTVRNADKSSAHVADRVAARIALDSALRHARASLGASHPAIDETPYFDDIDEFTVDNEFPEGFYDPNDPNGVMWDLEVSDISGFVDLNSASPHMLANLIGGGTRLLAKIDEKASSISVASTSGFEPAGFVWIGDEFVGYTEIEGNSLQGLVRGLAASTNDEGEPSPCGPQLAHPHALGVPVLDDRVWAIARWRALPGDELRLFDAIEQVAEAESFTPAENLGFGALETLVRTATVYGGVRAGDVWQRPVRLIGNVAGGQDACRLLVDDLRWFNAGTTVRITDGQTTEIGLVRDTRSGAVILMEPLKNEYAAYTAVVQPLSRRPVNINTAPPEVLRALFLNLQLRGRTPRITPTKANQLAAVVVESRPFDSFEDFVRRIVLPSAGLEALPKNAPVVPAALASQGGDPAPGFLDQEDAQALYKNALNANDNELAYSTMPFAFTSRDVYQLDLRAAVNAASGVKRVAARRDQVELLIPQRDLLQVWARQEDFDETMRLERRGKGWATGPEVTTRFDPLYGSDPPTRTRAHLGPHDSYTSTDPVSAAAEYTFADRETIDGWAQLAPSRTDEEGVYRQRGRILHFDDESRDLEGRYLPDGTISFPTNTLDWNGYRGLMKPISFSMWLNPRSLAEGERFFDVGGAFPDSDRISLSIDQGDLLLSVLDGAGDHPGTTLVERGEVRYSLADEAGMPLDTWIHVEADVRGNRPDQMTLLVDGEHKVETRGLTRLTSGISFQATSIPVESTEGFPDLCVLRIGPELIEARKNGESSFDARHVSAGADAGWGGRFARELMVGPDTAPTNTGVGDLEKGDYPSETPVQLYGFAARLETNMSPASARLNQALGPFRVGHVTGADTGGGISSGPSLSPIIANVNLIPAPIAIGFGIRASDDLRALQIRPAADLNTELEVEDLMAAFNRDGGFAALASTVTINLNGGEVEEDVDGGRLAGVEALHYTGWEIDQGGETATLFIDARAGAGLRRLVGADSRVTGAGSFVIEWVQNVRTAGNQIYNDLLVSQTMVFPISIPGAAAFETLSQGSSFAQITRASGNAEQTEWVRYDEVARNQLVRSDPFALLAAAFASHAGLSAVTGDPFDPNPGGGGGGGGGGPGPGNPGNPGGPTEPPGQPLQGEGDELRLVVGPSSAVPALVDPARGRTAPASSPQGSSTGWAWSSYLGVAPDVYALDPVSKATWSQFQHRGVLGTYPQEHPAGVTILPVFAVVNAGRHAGFPGRYDSIMIHTGDPEDPGFPARVHRGYRPLDYSVYTWESDPTGATWGAGEVDTQADLFGQGGFNVRAYYFALEEASPVPVAAGLQSGFGNSGGGANDPSWETRELARIVLFPSGERPRVVNTVAIGGGFQGSGSGGQVPSATADEVVLGWGDFAARSSNIDAISGGGLVLRTSIQAGGDILMAVVQGQDPEADEEEIPPDVAADANDGSLGAPNGRIEPDGTLLFTPMGMRSFAGGQFLTELPEDAGLLRIGDEILCYDSRSPGSGTLHIPPNGRGLLGTDPGPHVFGEGIFFLEGLRVSILASDIGPEDGILPIADTEGFPQAGTVLIGDELVHYTAINGGALWMPRRSTLPGRMDGRGAGLFRGRYGTVPAGHGTGTPVILYPYRYPDRWEIGAEAPELAFLGFSLDQPNAFWHRFFFETEGEAQDGPRIGVLARSDPSLPWDTSPEDVEELELFYDGLGGGEGNAIGEQADRMEWRVFVEHRPNSYDALTGLSHGWKRTPRLKLFGVEFMGPGMTLRRAER